MGGLVSQKCRTNGEASPSSLIPGSFLSRIEGEVGIKSWITPLEPGGEKILRLQLSFIQAMLSIKGETGLALGERRGVTDDARGGTALGLRANVLKGNN